VRRPVEAGLNLNIDAPPAGAAETAPLANNTPAKLDDVPLGPLEEMLSICELRFLERALAAAHGNRSRAAAILKLHRATLYQRMKRVGLPTRNP